MSAIADSSSRQTSPAGAVERTLAVLEVLAQAEEPLKLSDVAQRLDMPKSAAHRLLSSLVEAGWAEQSAQSDCYGLTLHMALLGQGQLARLNITNMRQPILDELARQSKELVRLTELRNNGLVWIGSARGRRSGLVYEPDMNERIVPFATANGKAWLSTLSWDDAARIALDTGLGRVTLGPGTVTTLEQLRAELDRTRARGYGLALEEAEEGVGAVAVAVATRDGVVGTMSVAAPIGRLDARRLETLVPALQRAAADMGRVW